MDLEAAKKRLAEISAKNKKSAVWKPSNGKQNIRLVPSKDQRDNPFIELLFHYDFNGKTYLSPASFGRPDPIAEIANKLRKSGDKDEYELSKKFSPKMRIYAPVIVRGEEDQGVRFWGFGRQVYQALLGIVSDEDYGDITDLKEGNDITVHYIPKEDSGKSFPETQIRPRPKKTVVGDSDVIESIKNQPSIKDVFEEPSYDDLKVALDKYLNPEEEDDDDDGDLEDEEETDTSETDVEDTDDDDDDVEPVSTKKAAPKNKAKKKTSVAETSNSFDELFGD